MKTMYLPAYHHNGFVATHALGYMMYRCAKCMSSHKAIVVITGRAHCFHDCKHTHTQTHTHTHTHTQIQIYIYVYVYLYSIIYILLLALY